MKKALLYLLMFSYTIIICKPMMPAVMDGVAHVFWYSEHMATVHFENGKYHVHLANMEAAKKGSPEKNNSLKEDESVNIHMSPSNSYHFTSYFPAQNEFFNFSSALADTDTSSHYPPPRVA